MWSRQFLKEAWNSDDIYFYDPKPHIIFVAFVSQNFFSNIFRVAMTPILSFEYQYFQLLSEANFHASTTWPEAVMQNLVDAMYSEVDKLQINFPWIHLCLIVRAADVPCIFAPVYTNPPGPC